MSLTGVQLARVHQAILSGYDRATFQQVVKVGLEVNFDAIAPATGFDTQVSTFLSWAERTGHTAALLAASYNHNPNNADLQRLIVDAQKWAVGVAAGLTLFEGRAYVFATPAKERVYLDRLLQAYAKWVAVYTPLPGVTEVAGSLKPRIAVDATGTILITSTATSVFAWYAMKWRE
ncbi:MAG: hypothetical protein IPK16_08345 [Anaerolineales bacterium]|nr:hypothetical protein [Anaerolineales bacterium]